MRPSVTTGIAERRPGWDFTVPHSQWQQRLTVRRYGPRAPLSCRVAVIPFDEWEHFMAYVREIEACVRRDEINAIRSEGK